MNGLRAAGGPVRGADCPIRGQVESRLLSRKQAVSGPSGKSPDDAGDLSSRSIWGEPEWGLTCLDRTDTRRIPENPR